ncbi:MAG TPA: hypothetical protein PLC35_08840 [Methanosarcina vacuolata]|nr:MULTISPECIES: hypothetical protein [Methanosarcina]HPS90059.1 hypothetical protein [Methanosarcina vacuolata]
MKMIERISLKISVSSGYELPPVPKWDWETRSVEINASNGNEYRLEEPV